MRCSKCGNDTPAGKKFCEDCGAPLANPCPKCGAETTTGKRFCGECGAPLEPTAPTSAEARDGSLTGERRHLTVLFCDLVGSTEIAAQLDPEEWRELVGSYHHAAAEAITRYSGHVAQYLGDGVMAYFGWPEAHENDAERAARAGLAILEAVSELNQESTNPKISVRVGIDSGTVVVGAGAGKDTDVFGETPNIAARVQTAAAPDTVLITGATHRLISGLFVAEESGNPQLKGIRAPIKLYHVIRPSGVHGRLQAVRGLTPFVGREEEIRLLLSRWEQAREGDGQVALIIGEPGIGKSRVVAEFHNRIRDTPHIWLESGGEQVFENTPFHVIIEMLSRWLELQGAANAQEQFERVERSLASAGLAVAEIAPLIADLLRLEIGERYPALTLAAEEKRRRLLAALSGWVLGVARERPVVMVIEDLHWLDPSTLELIRLLAEEGVMVPLMLMCTARPEFHAQWPMRSHHNHIALDRLSSHNVREMVALVVAHSTISNESLEMVVERTGGVPLFVEELTRAVLESGSGIISGRDIPVTLHDSLMARLDRLGPSKAVVQIGAAIGREFSRGLLQAVHPIAEQDLQGALQEATDAKLVNICGTTPDVTYQFRHALIRDTAYGALLRSRRKELHSRIAEALVRQFQETVISAPELLAFHYTEAGSIRQAIPYWHRAGQRASQRSAHLEAIGHHTKALQLLETLPDTPERSEQELTLQLSLGPSLVATKGQGAPEAERVYVRALALCQGGGETSQLFRVQSGLWAVYIVQGKLQKARELGEQLLTLAQDLRNPLFLLVAHEALGTTLLWLGAYSAGRMHLEEGIALYDPPKRRSGAFRAVQDPGVDCFSFSAMALWFLGYPDQAVTRISEAVALARQLAHPYSMAYALSHKAIVHHMCRAVPAAQQWAEEAMTVCSEHGFPFFLSMEMVVRGWALVEQGQKAEGLPQIQQGLALYGTTGSGINWPWLSVMSAEAQGRTGQPKEGLNRLADALALVDKTGERWWEAEVYRVKGELTLQIRHQSPPFNVEEVAKSCFFRSIEIAQQQGAKSWQLRATISLARLLAHQGHRDAACTMLAQIYNWFTEGFDTADLKEAKALLDELSE